MKPPRDLCGGKPQYVARAAREPTTSGIAGGAWQPREGVTTCSGCFLLAARWFSDGRMDYCYGCAVDFLGAELAR